MDRCTVTNRAPRDKRHSALTGSSSASAELDSSEASFIIEGEEFVCPICHGDSFELETLIKHLDNEHAIQQRSARCPVCNKSTRDMLQHLIVHQRASEEYLCASPSSQASSSLSRSMSTEWARAAKQEEDMLLKLKAASLSGSPSSFRQTALTDKHGRLKHGAEKATPSSQADDALSKASKQSRASKQGTVSKPKPVVADTPELRSQFIREILLSALELDRSL